MLSVFKFHVMPFVNIFCAVICGSLLGREFTSVSVQTRCSIFISNCPEIDRYSSQGRSVRRRSSSNWSQNRTSLFLNSNFFRWLKIQTSAACMMCTVTMSMDRTERPSCLLQFKSVYPTVIAKTGSWSPGFYLQRARERHMH